jgi:hypothetical protein
MPFRSLNNDDVYGPAPIPFFVITIDLLDLIIIAPLTFQVKNKQCFLTI